VEGAGKGQTDESFAQARTKLAELRQTLAGVQRLSDVPADQRWEVRKNILEVNTAVNRLRKAGLLPLTEEEGRALKENQDRLLGLTEFAPTWVLVGVASALGIGTMVGWKRIVVTVGEKIGASHLTYAQGACAETVAMCTIGLADGHGLPVSTTHVLSSGVAGTMVANRSGVQLRTVRAIALAWVLTLPVAMLLAGGLFLLLRLVLA
jgi:PiT family inorganic phosphate transporter